MSVVVCFGSPQLESHRRTTLPNAPPPPPSPNLPPAVLVFNFQREKDSAVPSLKWQKKIFTMLAAVQQYLSCCYKSCTRTAVPLYSVLCINTAAGRCGTTSSPGYSPPTYRYIRISPQQGLQHNHMACRAVIACSSELPERLPLLDISPHVGFEPENSSLSYFFEYFIERMGVLCNVITHKRLPSPPAGCDRLCSTGSWIPTSIRAVWLYDSSNHNNIHECCHLYCCQPLVRCVWPCASL